MERINGISRLLLAASAFVLSVGLSVSAFVFVLQYNPSPAHAVAVSKEDPTVVFTQSQNGETLYSWRVEGSAWKRKASSETR